MPFVRYAKTGSGKTAAFALPVVQTLSEDPFGVCCVVLTPSRELVRFQTLLAYDLFWDIEDIGVWHSSILFLRREGIGNGAPHQ